LIQCGDGFSVARHGELFRLQAIPSASVFAIYSKSNLQSLDMVEIVFEHMLISSGVSRFRFFMAFVPLNHHSFQGVILNNTLVVYALM
jgi:hypothetical protein